MIRGAPVMAVAIVALTSVPSCLSSPGGPSSVPIGVWGADRIEMVVGAAATHVELDCAHGDVSGPLATGPKGEFSVRGTFVRERGGPIRADEQIDRRPALYEGSAHSNRMSLTIRLTDTGELVGSFTLDFGSTGRIVKCL